MRLSRTLARPADQLPPRQPKPNEVVYHHQLREEVRQLHGALERERETVASLISGVHALIDVQAQQHALLSNRHDALDLALAMYRARVESNRLTNRVKRVLFWRIF